jgi:hypothetical protein
VNEGRTLGNNNKPTIMRTLVLVFLLFPLLSTAQDQSKVEIYPNPVTDVLTIKVGQHEDAANIKIISESGQIVWSEHKSETEFSLNLEHYPKGVYYVQIAVKDKVEVCRFIKK